MSESKSAPNDVIAARLADREGVYLAFEKAHRAVLQRALQTGRPVVIWRNGRVEHVPAEELLAELPEFFRERTS